jgi:hypothetical protein
VIAQAQGVKIMELMKIEERNRNIQRKIGEIVLKNKPSISAETPLIRDDHSKENK